MEPSPVADIPPRPTGGAPAWWARRAPWLAFSLAVLAVALVGAFEQRRRGDLPAATSDGLIAFPVAVDGGAAGSLEELRVAAQRRRVGELLEVPPAPALALVPEVSILGLVLTLVSALCYVAVCALVLAPRAASSAARRLSLAMAGAALGIAIGGAYPPVGPWGLLLLVAFVLALCAMPAAFVAFALEFPVRRPAGRSPWIRAALLVLPAGLAAWNVAARLQYERSPLPEQFAQAGAAYRAIEVLLLAGFLVGCVLLVAAARHATWARERAQARWLLWGIAVAMTPFVVLRCLPRLLGLGESPVPPEVDRLVELAAPAAFAVAVARHLLLDVDVVIRRSLIASVLAVLLAAAVLGVVLLLGRGGVLPLPEPAVWLAAGLLAGGLYPRARRAVARWVDRTFFRIRHEHERALSGLSAALAQAAEPSAVGGVLERAVAAELEPAHVQAHLAADEAQRPRCEAASRAGLGDGRPRAEPAAVTVTDLAPPEQAAWPAGAVLLQPLARAGRLHGLLALGPRASGHRYVHEDLEFLAAAGAEAGRALERLDLVRTLAAEASARSALAALDQQRRDFLLRVAHDLRTPLTAVRWSAANLKDGVAGDLSTAQGQELEGILAASGQLSRLVDNLVALSRMEAGDPGAAPEAVPWAPVVREAAAALTPIARAKGVALDVRVGEVAPVRGRRDACSQVVMNLVDNALKYAPPGSAVEVSLAAGDGGAVLRVRDRGPGLQGKPAGELFGLFRQGAGSPHASAKGFGVGLHVVKSWVEAFGGSVEGADHPEGGAVFTARLPAWQTSASADAAPSVGGGCA